MELHYIGDFDCCNQYVNGTLKSICCVICIHQMKGCPPDLGTLQFYFKDAAVMAGSCYTSN